jgi:ribosomal-protein-alanine N-acetyltransferase
MAFLRSTTGHDNAVTLRGRGVWLRAPLMGDYAPWAELRALSRDHLTPWEPVWQRDELSRSAFRRRVRYYQRESREDLGYAFLIFSDVGDQLIGGLTLSNVRRGVTQAAVLGDWLG